MRSDLPLALLIPLVAALCLVTLSCPGPGFPGADDDGHGDDDEGDDDTAGCSPEGDHTCWGSDWMVCDGGAWTVEETCTAPTPLCDPALGCVVCEPGSTYCDGDRVMLCAPDGMSASMVDECTPPETCVNGECLDACDIAAQQYSYYGCRFMAVTTDNAVLPAAFDGDFAVVIGNPEANGVDAEVTVSRGGQVAATATVPFGQTRAIPLSMVPELKAAQQTALVADGAYEVVTTVPVVAYQYNPLHFEINGSHSYTNDASLLLPEHSLTGEYRVNTWPTWGHGGWDWVPIFGAQGEWDYWYPGFLAVVGTVDGTQVTVTSTTHTQGGDIAALIPGGQAMVTLNRGDVLQVLSYVPPDSEDPNYCAGMGWESHQTGSCPPQSFGQECEVACSVTGGDLTGSTVSASAPVAVLAGHQCTFMPYYSWACDHLEESMFPVETWGDLAVMTAPMHPDGNGVAWVDYRVMSGDPGNQITFTPEAHPPVTLDPGEFVEFTSVLDFVVEGTGRFYATQTLLGQDEIGTSAGDPAMGSGIPWTQVRADYDFLTPETYTSNWVNVVAQSGSSITLDGSPVGGWQAIDSTGYDVARVQVQPGSHHAASTDNSRFGITIYGYASYTSYLLPGGMNFER